MSSVITQIALGVRTNCTVHIILGQELTSCNPEATATKKVLNRIFVLVITLLNPILSRK